MAGHDQFSPLGAIATNNVDKSVVESPTSYDQGLQVIDVSVGVPDPTPTPTKADNPRPSVARTRSLERQLPKFPHGLFNRRDWDVNRDFGPMEEVGRGKDTMIYKSVCHKPLGKDQVAGKVCAVKVYTRTKVSHTKLRAIKREVAMMMFMEAKGVPNIVHAYTAFADDLHYYIVMEYCEGGDLLEWILARKKALHERDALASIVIPLLNTLTQMHSLGLIHRDIKLENIFLGKDLCVKLGDFGQTMSTYQETAISPVGTVEYMAPEILALPPVDMVLRKTVDPKTIEPNDSGVDIWALGVTLFELVTGKLPFTGNDKSAIKQAIRHYEISSFPSVVSVGCRNIILEMLAYRAEDRPSAFSLKRRITRWLAGDSPVAQPILRVKQTKNSSNEETNTKVDVDADGDVHMATATASASAMTMDSAQSDERRDEKRSSRSGSGLSRVLRKFSGSTKKLFPF